ncbi:ACP S-malonyltransferase [Flexivirga sp. ID2601S]|uniref:[acyl-carrier-protein] S-malonyltransferase n=1 Tax=Flexivirga aerilata TaxID=1656889 RepID=A0A849AJD0_9MICO|nr:ACP S-malonyltransferase [Flexivirga aerilata]NNG38510.1 ACP S-malonyltransferase [Flexivirga aerilata]
MVFSASHSAWVFPGQGSQEPGMGEDLRLASGTYRTLLEHASELTATHFDPAVPVQPVDGGGVHPTVLTQLSVFTVSVGLADALLQAGERPQVLAGHSVGEFAALAAGGWLEPSEALELVFHRASAMAACCRQEASMMAVLGIAPEIVANACAGSDAVLANYNAVRQTVVSGPTADLFHVGACLRDLGATVVELDVAGAFHSNLMAPARDALAPRIAAANLRPGHTPMISSISGSTISDVGRYRAALSEQVTAPVQWTAVLRTLDDVLPDDGGVLEIGPGRVLRGLQRKHDRRRPVGSCSSWAEAQELIQQPTVAAG